MTKIEFDLPDALAKEAKRAGLLAPAEFERLLREELRKEAVDRLFEDMDRLSALPEPLAMSPEQVSVELRAMRIARRKAKAA